MSNVTTLSDEFEIEVPQQVYESQGWKPGQKLSFVPADLNSYFLVPVPTFEAPAGSTEDLADPDDKR
jgi:hypothetical protein